MTTPSGILYQDCSKLPLSIFIDCIIDGDLSGLGTGDVHVIWDKIYVESVELSNSGTYNEALALMKEINDLMAKITIANNTIQHLQMSFDAELVAVLNSFALQCTLTVDDKAGAIVSKLNAVVARMKKWFPKLARLEKDLADMRKNEANKITRSWFEDWLDIIGQSSNCHIEAENITVSRFYRSISKLKQKDIEAQTQKTKNARRF